MSSAPCYRVRNFQPVEEICSHRPAEWSSDAVSAWGATFPEGHHYSHLIISQSAIYTLRDQTLAKVADIASQNIHFKTLSGRYHLTTGLLLLSDYRKAIQLQPKGGKPRIVAQLELPSAGNRRLVLIGAIALAAILALIAYRLAFRPN
jgi:hypothetical protein